MGVAGTEKLSRKLQSGQYQRKARRIVKRNGADLSDKTKNNMSRVYTGHYEYLEMGTRFMAKRPALIPAFRTQGQIFIKELKGLMND